MASPVITPTVDAASYAPGAPITASWTVVDPDNATEELRLQGTDADGNSVSVTVTINRQDSFTMERVYWPRTGVNLTIDNTARRATGIVPGA
jgi:ribosomal protein L11